MRKHQYYILHLYFICILKLLVEVCSMFFSSVPSDEPGHFFGLMLENDFINITFRNAYNFCYISDVSFTWPSLRLVFFAGSSWLLHFAFSGSEASHPEKWKFLLPGFHCPLHFLSFGFGFSFVFWIAHCNRSRALSCHEAFDPIGQSMLRHQLAYEQHEGPRWIHLKDWIHR